MSPPGRQRQAGRHAARFPATDKQSFTDRITRVPLVPLLTCLDTLAFSRFVVHLYLTGHPFGICAWNLCLECSIQRNPLAGIWQQVFECVARCACSRPSSSSPPSSSLSFSHYCPTFCARLAASKVSLWSGPCRSARIQGTTFLPLQHLPGLHVGLQYCTKCRPPQVDFSCRFAMLY
jgi:hypothetical protein